VGEGEGFDVQPDGAQFIELGPCNRAQWGVLVGVADRRMNGGRAGERAFARGISCLGVF